MKIKSLLPILFLFSCTSQSGDHEVINKTQLLAEKKPHVNTRHGKDYIDYYHWLRDPSYPQIESDEILEYLQLHEQHANKYFEDKQATFNTIFDEIKSRLPQGKSEYSWIDDDFKYSYEYQQGSEFKTWYIHDLTTNQKQEILDENIRQKQADDYRLLALKVSPDKKFVALIENSNSTARLSIKTLVDNKLIRAPITDVSQNFEWSADSNKLFFVELDETGRDYRVAMLDVADLDSAPTIIYQEKDDDRFVEINKSISTKYLIITTRTRTNVEQHVIDLDTKNFDPKLVFSRTEKAEFYLDHANGKFIADTNIFDENYDVVTFDKIKWNKDKATVIVDSPSGSTIKETIIFDTFIATHERKDGIDQLRITDLQTNQQHFVKFNSPVFGLTFGGLKQSPKSRTLRVRYESFLTPRTVYDYSIDTKTLKALHVRNIPNFDPLKYTAKTIRVPSTGNVNVPVSIVYNNKYPPNEDNPLYLYTYGSYGNGIPPEFPFMPLSLMDRGFTYAIAHVRGGDELGKNWHEQGRLMNRKNSFDDFIEVAKYLTNKGMVKKGNIFASAESSGGTILAVAMNRNPELFHTVGMLVPFVDVVNTLSDDTLAYTIGDWTEFGNPIASAAEHDYLLSYSPYENIKQQNYPNIYVSAALDDPGVGYWEVAKYVAKLSEYKTDDNELIFDIRTGGHIEVGRYARYTDFVKFLTMFAEESKQ